MTTVSNVEPTFNGILQINHYFLYCVPFGNATRKGGNLCPITSFLCWMNNCFNLHRIVKFVTKPNTSNPICLFSTVAAQVNSDYASTDNSLLGARLSLNHNARTLPQPPLATLVPLAQPQVKADHFCISPLISIRSGAASFWAAIALSPRTCCRRSKANFKVKSLLNKKNQEFPSDVLSEDSAHRLSNRQAMFRPIPCP